LRRKNARRQPEKSLQPDQFSKKPAATLLLRKPLVRLPVKSPVRLLARFPSVNPAANNVPLSPVLPELA
jgi:hypothetical protein